MLNRFTLDELEGKTSAPQKTPFVFGTPATRQVDQTGTIVKRPAPGWGRKRDAAGENPFDEVTRSIANFSAAPTAKKRRKLPDRKRKEPERFGFLDKF